MIAALGGVDLLVFTGGVGENDVKARAAICDGLSWLGVSLDEARNRSTNNPINDSGSRCAVQVLASQEDEQIARHTKALFRRNLFRALTSPVVCGSTAIRDGGLRSFSGKPF